MKQNIKSSLHSYIRLIAYHRHNSHLHQVCTYPTRIPDTPYQATLFLVMVCVPLFHIQSVAICTNKSLLDWIYWNVIKYIVLAFITFCNSIDICYHQSQLFWHCLNSCKMNFTLCQRKKCTKLNPWPQQSKTYLTDLTPSSDCFPFKSIFLIRFGVCPYVSSLTVSVIPWSIIH